MIKIRIHLTLIAISFFILPTLEAQSGPVITLAVFDNETANKSAKILEKVYKEAGLKLNIVVMPAARATKESIAGRVDGEIARNDHYGDPYPTLIRVAPPLCIRTRYIFYSHLIKENIYTVHDLKNYTVGYVRGMIGIGELLKGVPKKHELSDSKSLMQMLKLNRIQVAINTTEKSDIRSQLGDSKNIKWKEFERVQIHHYLHIKNQKLVPEISSIIKKFKDSGKLAKMCD